MPFLNMTTVIWRADNTNFLNSVQEPMSSHRLEKPFQQTWWRHSFIWHITYAVKVWWGRICAQQDHTQNDILPSAELFFLTKRKPFLFLEHFYTNTCQIWCQSQHLIPETFYNLILCFVSSTVKSWYTCGYRLCQVWNPLLSHLFNLSTWEICQNCLHSLAK